MNKNKQNQNAAGGSTPKTPNTPKNGKNKESCKICQEAVTKKDKGMMCDICGCWYHCKCIQMEDQAYNFYKNYEKINWVCCNCIKEKKEENSLYDLIAGMMKSSEEEKKAHKNEKSEMINMMKELNVKMTKMEGDQNDKMNKIFEQINKIEEKIDDKVNEKLKISEKEILSKVNSEIDEKMERLKRSKNLIIYGMPECKNEGTKENMQRADEQKVEKLLRELEVTVSKLNVTRLGKNMNVEGRPRPIKLDLENEWEKFNILKRAGKIKTINTEEFRKIILSADLTMKQRELDRNLREELKERRMKGEINIKIKNGRIIREEQGNSETQA